MTAATITINGGLLALCAALVAGVLVALVMVARANATLMRQLLAVRAGDFVAAVAEARPHNAAPQTQPKRAIVSDFANMPPVDPGGDAFAELSRRIAAGATYPREDDA